MQIDFLFCNLMWLLHIFFVSCLDKHVGLYWAYQSGKYLFNINLDARFLFLLRRFKVVSNYMSLRVMEASL